MLLFAHVPSKSFLLRQQLSKKPQNKMLQKCENCLLILFVNSKMPYWVKMTHSIKNRLSPGLLGRGKQIFKAFMFNCKLQLANQHMRVSEARALKP